MVQKLAITESNISKVTNQNISKMVGVTTFVSMHTSIDIEELNFFVERLIDYDDSIIGNLGIFEDTTAIYLYPYEDNIDMSNINLAEIPFQREDALIVKNLLEVVITPPVELVQGGMGIMTRMPIVLEDDTYWGQLGYMMRYEDILEVLELDTNGYSYLITQYNEYDDSSHVVYDSGFEGDFLTDEVIVQLPSGYWRVQIGYDKILGLTSPSFYILIVTSFVLFGLSLYIVSSFKRHNEELSYLSNRDELTGLKNRRAIKESLESFNTAVMIDLDDFKDINDAFGHNVGDQVLSAISRMLENQVRHDDVVVRWGGEEFLILMASSSEENAKITSDRILKAFREPLNIDGKNINVTASIGVVCASENSESQMSILIAAADKAMYISKNNGKNQVKFGNISSGKKQE